MELSLSAAPITGGGYNNNKQLRRIPVNSSYISNAANALSVISNSNRRRKLGNLAVQAKYSNSDGDGADFVAGFILGGTICGTLAYIFAPQIRRSLLNEDEYGFQKARRPIYYDDQGLEKTRQTLNAKLSQLNAAIDNVSTRLRGGSGDNMPVQSDSQVQAPM